MKYIKYIILAAALVTGLASCSVTRHHAYAPAVTQLSLQMEDLEYLGESEISVDYRRYLGFITVTDQVNGVAYDREEIKRFPLGSMASANELQGKLDRASYKLLEDFPDADYFIVTGQTRQKNQLFLGSNISATAKVKAYRFKK